uniref:RxLR effector candidate protein n=2 Tax=Hyaloperonospora arabidopsidis (strain Emoy2) TaxID=559515 RepID=M4BGW5_HYAAE
MHLSYIIAVLVSVGTTVQAISESQQLEPSAVVTTNAAQSVESTQSDPRVSKRSLRVQEQEEDKKDGNDDTYGYGFSSINEERAVPPSIVGEVTKRIGMEAPDAVTTALTAMNKLDDLHALKSLELSAGAQAGTPSAQDVAKITLLRNKVDVRRNNAATMDAISAGKGVLNPHGDLTTSLQYADAVSMYKSLFHEKTGMSMPRFREFFAKNAPAAYKDLDADTIYSTYHLNKLRKELDPKTDAKLYSTGKVVLDKIEKNPIALKHFGLLKDTESQPTQSVMFNSASIVGTIDEKMEAVGLLIRARGLTKSLQQKKAAQELAQKIAPATKSDDITKWVDANGRSAVTWKWDMSIMKQKAGIGPKTARDSDAYKKLNGLIMARLADKGKAKKNTVRFQEIQDVKILLKKNKIAQALLPEAVQSLKTRGEFETKILGSIATPTDKDKTDATAAAALLIRARHLWSQLQHGI